MPWILFYKCVVVFTAVLIFTASFDWYEYRFEKELYTLTSEELFEYGQHYFNHGDGKDGKYNLDMAYRYYGLLAVSSDQHPLVWYQLGRIDFLEGSNNLAIQKFAVQERLFGDLVPKVFYMRALTHGYAAIRTGDQVHWEIAELYFKRYLSFQSNAPWPYVDLAWVYFSQGKYDAMYELLKPHTDEFGDNAWFQNMLGLAVWHVLGPPHAIPIFEQTIVLLEPLTEQDWGNVYPGNNPQEWGRGLAEFRVVVTDNLVQAQRAAGEP